MPAPTDRLATYRSMRDPGRTPEPMGGGGAGSPEAGGPEAGTPSVVARFAIQEHHATSMHWDLRLEHGGVLLSWAVPKGLPRAPGEAALAVHTEDHPLQYLTFEGDIPEGSYGAGHMSVWDSGTYELHDLGERRVEITLHGERVHGRYVLSAGRGRDWVVVRKDPPQDPSWQPMPTGLRPMRAVPGDLPSGDGWAFEVRWPGQPVLLAVEGGRVDGTLPDGSEVGDRFPELRAMARGFSSLTALVHAVLVVTGPGGRPDLDRLAQRCRARSASAAKRMADEHPAACIAIDLLWLEGHPACPLPYEDRRRLLHQLPVEHPTWQVPAHHTGAGAGTAMLAAAREQGLPGVVAKRLGSPYRPGEAAADWLQVDV